MGGDNIMFEKIVEIVREFYEEGEITEFTKELSLMDDLGFSSLEFFSFITAIEEEFSIRITEREIQTLVTVEDVVGVVENKLATK